MRSIPESRVFTRSELRRNGWSDAAISRAVRSGRLSSLRRGQLTLPTGAIPEVHVRAAAAANACADAAVSHRCALLTHELPLVGAWPLLPEITVPPRQLGRLTDAHLYRATLPAGDVVDIGGVPVTSIARTLVDVARHRPLGCSVAAIDAALHRGLVMPPDLDEVVFACRHWPRIRRALRARQLVDGRSESPLESVSRLVLSWQHVPAPQLQAVIRDELGRFVARTDFYWPQFGVVGEADGAVKYTDRDTLLAEKRRQEALEELGLIVVRWGWDDIAGRPRLVADRLNGAFARAQRRDRSGFRPLWSVSAA